MAKEDLIKDCFYITNGFKRARALEGIEKEKGNHNDAIFRRLQQYELIDRLELTMRALQKEIREEDSENNSLKTAMSNALNK